MSRSVVNVDARLLREAMRLTGLRREVDVVNEGLRLLVARGRPERRFARLRGRVAWEGDLNIARHGR